MKKDVEYENEVQIQFRSVGEKTICYEWNFITNVHPNYLEDL